MEPHGTAWKRVEPHGTTWNRMEPRGVLTFVFLHPQIRNLYYAVDMDSDINALLDLREFWVMHKIENLDKQVMEWLIKLQVGLVEESRKLGKGRDNVMEQTWLNWLGSKDDLFADLPKR